MVSSETGIDISCARIDNMVTVIDAIKLVTIITERRPAMCLILFCFPAMREDETLHMTCGYNTIMQVNVRILHVA